MYSTHQSSSAASCRGKQGRCSAPGRLMLSCMHLPDGFSLRSYSHGSPAFLLISVKEESSATELAAEARPVQICCHRWAWFRNLSEFAFGPTELVWVQEGSNNAPNLFHPGIHHHLKAWNIYCWQRDIDCLATGRVKIIERKKKEQATKQTRKIAPVASCHTSVWCAASVFTAFQHPSWASKAQKMAFPFEFIGEWFPAAPRHFITFLQGNIKQGPCLCLCCRNK